MRGLAGLGLSILALAPAALAQEKAQEVAQEEKALMLPSGLEARLQEVLTDRRAGTGLIYRFRFVAAGLEGGEAAFDRVTADLEWLCTAYALPRLSDIGPRPARVVISVADRPSRFGVHDPDTVEVFEAFRPGDGTCNWEMF